MLDGERHHHRCVHERINTLATGLGSNSPGKDSVLFSFGDHVCFSYWIE